MTPRIIQCVGNLSKGDAISNYIMTIHELLGEMGYESHIVAYDKEECMNRACSSLDNLQPRSTDVAILHASIGNPMLKIFEGLPCRKGVIYHNMTPASYFKGYHELLFSLLVEGRESMRTLANTVPVAFGVSEFNRKELQEFGFASTGVLPYVLPPESLDEEDTNLSRSLKEHRGMKLLFVGRVVPHKCQHDLIKVLYLVRKHIDEQAVLYLVGHGSQEEPYWQQCKQLCHMLGLDRAVFMTGRVSDEQLASYYHHSDVFVSMSEHEGFFVPLIEAFRSQLPVLAYGAGAIPETMGGAGLCLEEKDFREALAQLKKLQDTTYRQQVTKKQQERVEAFSMGALQQGLAQLLDTITSTS